MQNERHLNKIANEKREKYYASEVDPSELEYMKSEQLKSLDLVTKDNSQNILKIAPNDSGFLLDRKRYRE